MATKYVDEFLYRGRADDTKSAWHVVLAVADTDPFGKSIVHLSDPMTPEQAEKEGFPLSAILADINAQTLADLGTTRADLAAAVDANEALSLELGEAKSA